MPIVWALNLPGNLVFMIILFAMINPFNEYLNILLKIPRNGGMIVFIDMLMI